MSVVNADYTTVIGYLRSHLGNGTQLSGYEMGRALAVIQDAVARGTAENTAQEAVRTGLTTQITATATQATAITAIRTAIVGLDAATITGGIAAAAALIATASANLATASTAVTAIGTALTASKADVLAGEVSVPTYVTSTVADGT